MRTFTMIRRPSALLVVGLLAASGIGCGGDDTADAMLELNFWEFDQDVDGGWRPYADRGEYARAADLIDHYLAHRSGLLEAERGYLHLHAGQLRSYDGDDQRALDHLAQAYVTPDSMTDRFPRSFNALAAGIRAFMMGDMAGVGANAETIRTMPGLTARDSGFLWSLDYLTTKEGMTYREAMFEVPE